MKNIFITLVLILLTINIYAQKEKKGQWFMGGEIGLNVNKSDVSYTMSGIDYIEEITKVGFVLAPKAGYSFNDKWALGLSIYGGINFSANNKNNYKYKEHTYSWNFCPFVQYTPFRYKKVFLTLEGSVCVGSSYSFWKLEDDDQRTMKLNTLTIGVFNITPILGFNLTNHLQLEAALHFLNIGYNMDITREENTDMNKITHDFNIGFNSSSILVMTWLKIGVKYKF